VSKIQEINARKNERKNKLLITLEKITTQLKMMGALKIVLFGSLSRGEVDTNSDIDLLIIMPSTKTGKEWLNIIYDQTDRKVAIDIIVYNENEFYKEFPFNSFLKNISNGKVIYEKT